MHRLTMAAQMPTSRLPLKLTLCDTFKHEKMASAVSLTALAKFISVPETNFKTLKHRLVAVAIALVPALIIILQHETGLALVYFCFFLVMYREGLPNAVLIVGFSIIDLVLAQLLIDR